MSLVSYVGATPLNRVDTQNRNTYVATAGQTMFPAVYTPGYVDVYKNGSKLRGPTGFAFTAIDGTSVVLTTEAVEGDVIEIVAIRASTPYDFYNKSQADFLAGNFYAVAGGSSDALLLTLSPLPTSLPDGIQFKVMTAVANTTTMPSVTIANLGISKYISGPGATPLYAGAWIANQCITLRYNLAGDRFEFLEFGTKGLQSNTMQKYTSSTTLTSADFGRLCFWAPSVPTSGLLMMPNAIGANGKIISVYCMGPGKVTLGSVGVNSLVAFGTSTTWVDLIVGESIGLCSDGINWIQVWGNRDSIPSANRTDWATKGNNTAVVGQLGWSRYGDGHTIFDASSGVSPSGTTVDPIDSSIRWVPGFPAIMGWDGYETCGVRVDSALVAKKSLDSIGVDQTWHDMTGVRFPGTTYTNSTGKPIMISLSANHSTADVSSMHIAIDGGAWFYLGIGSNSSGGNYCAGSIIIPSGSTYVVSVYIGIMSWWELR